MERRADERRNGEHLMASAPRSHTRGSKVRARPASAQPFSRAPTTTTSSNNAVGGSSRRRKEYWPRHLPPPWDEHSNNGDCSSRSGSAGGGDDDGGDGYCRRRGSRPASSGKRARVPTAAVGAAAAANLELRARMGAQSKWWDGSCAVGMDVAARRALAARVAAAAVEAGEAAGLKPKTPTEKALMSGGAGRPYMSRADRAAEESKEVAHLRREAEFWRDEAGAARQEAAETVKRLENQEQHIASVLQKTAEVLPGYCYGMDFGGCSSPEVLAGEPELSVLEHRRELEKVVVVRRLKGQVSRLLKRLVAAEEELIRVKRSCQFTALTEMRSTGEEYVKEVERLRAMLNKRTEPPDLLAAKPRDFRPPAVEIPSAVLRSPPNAKLPNAGETPSNIDVASSALESADHPDHPLSSDEGQSGSSSPVPGSKTPQQKDPQRSRGGQPDQQLLGYPTSQQRPRSHNRRGYYSPHNAPRLSKDAQHALDREPHARRGEKGISEVQQRTVSPSGEYVYPSHQQCSLAAARSRASRQVSRTPGDSIDRGRGRRPGGRRGEGVVHSRARAGLLGVPGPVGSRGYITIDAPMRGGASATRGDPAVKSGPRHDGHEGDRGGTAAKGGRVPMTTEMEMDVMKGLVLAQHQRIERQRGRMQELERDLRDYRRATVGGGEWPQASGTFSTSLRPASPSSRGCLRPSRSAPAGLYDVARDTYPAPATTTTTVARTQSLRAHSGGSRAPTAAQRRAEASRLLEETAWLKLKEASRIDGWEDGEGGIAPTDVSLAMNRPRTAAASAAAAVGSALTEAWCGRDLGGGKEGKPRPKSASSRLSSSPGRRRVRAVGGRGTKKGGGVGGESEKGVFEEKDCLPEGWAEAVDEDTGHVYYFSDKRSMWVRPTRPASPRTPVEAESGTVANADDVTGAAASLVAAATGLACSRLAASTDYAMGAKEKEEREEEEDKEEAGEGAVDGGAGGLEGKTVEGMGRDVYGEKPSNLVGATRKDSSISVGDGDACEQHPLNPLARDEPYLPRANNLLSSTSTSAGTDGRSCLRRESEDSPGLPHMVTAHANVRESSRPSHVEPHTNHCSTASLNEGAERSVGAVRGRRNERPPGQRNRDGEDDEHDMEENSNFSVDSDYAPPRPPECIPLAGTPAVPTAPFSATIHAGATGREEGDGQIGHKDGAAPDGGGHSLSLEETENAMAALIATLRPELNVPSFGEQSSPSAAAAPLNRDPSTNNNRVPPRWSSSSFPLTPDEADTDADPVSPQLYAAKTHLQRREEPSDACSPIATPSLRADRHYHVVQHRIEGTEHGNTVDGKKRLPRLPETGKTTEEGAGYGNDVLWDGLDIEMSSGVPGGAAGGEGSGEGGASGAATGGYEDDFDCD